MFLVILNSIKIMTYTLETLQKYMEVAGDPRHSIDDLFLRVSDGLYIRRTMTRGDLYKAMGYDTYDFAYPEPWTDTPEAFRLFKSYGESVTYTDPETGEKKIRNWQKGDPLPSLVWCYDPKEGSDRPSLFGYPVFDKDVIRNLGKAIKAKAMSGDVEHIDTSWLDKKENDADLHPLLIGEGEINGI